MKPMIDIMSWQRNAELQNITQKYQEQFVNANPSQKVVAAAKFYGDNRLYVDSTVAMNTSGTFGDYLARCADSIRANAAAQAAATASAWATKNITNVSNSYA